MRHSLTRAGTRSVWIACAAALALLGALVLGPARADARTITVPAQLVVLNGQDPEQPGHCSALTFVQWTHVENTTNARVTYTYKGHAGQKSGTPPFDNVIDWVITYTAPTGMDWINLGKSWKNGSTPDTCEDTAALIRAKYEPTASVELTLAVDVAACTSAKKTLARHNKRVAALRAKLRVAKGDARARIAKNLAKARVARAKAAANVIEKCS